MCTSEYAPLRKCRVSSARVYAGNQYWPSTCSRQVVSLICIGDIEHFVIFAGDGGVAIQGLDFHILAEGVVVARLFEFLFLGSKFLDDLGRGSTLRRIGTEGAFLGEGGGEKGQDSRKQRQQLSDYFHSGIVECLTN